MTSVAMCGWETGSINQIGNVTIATNGAVAVVTATPTPRSGSYCLKVSSGTNANVRDACGVAIGLSGSPAEHYGRVGVWLSTAGGDPNRYRILLEFFDSLSGLQLRLVYANLNGALQLWR